MPAFIRTQTHHEVHAQVDPSCDAVILFLRTLLNEEWMYAPLDTRIEAFEAIHLRRCRRCQQFSQAFQAWLEQNARERMDAAIADERQMLRQLNGLEG